MLLYRLLGWWHSGSIPSLGHMWIEFVWCGVLSLAARFFSLAFPPSAKINMSWVVYVEYISECGVIVIEKPLLGSVKVFFIFLFARIYSLISREEEREFLGVIYSLCIFFWLCYQYPYYLCFNFFMNCRESVYVHSWYNLLLLLLFSK